MAQINKPFNVCIGASLDRCSLSEITAHEFSNQRSVLNVRAIMIPVLPQLLTPSIPNEIDNLSLWHHYGFMGVTFLFTLGKQLPVIVVVMQVRNFQLLNSSVFFPWLSGSPNSLCFQSASAWHFRRNSFTFIKRIIWFQNNVLRLSLFFISSNH